MSSTEEVGKPKAVTAAEKPVKEKKPKAPKEKKPKAAKTAAHPPYFEMIKEALLALNERSGSSPYAIAKFMEEKHKAVLPANFRKILGLQLKNCATKGKLNKIKASYKLSESGKKEGKTAASKPAVARAAPTKKPATTRRTAAPTKKPGTIKAKAPAAKTGTKRKAEGAKKAGTPKKVAKNPAQAKPKQPKSIKSPAPKKARKAAS